MSLMDLDRLSKAEFISQFILDRRGRGLFLAYGEYEYIEQWLELAGQDENKLLIVLNDILPEQATQQRPLPLKVFHKKVSTRLRETKLPLAILSPQA